MPPSSRSLMKMPMEFKRKRKMPPSMNELEIEKQSEYNSVKQLLKQVYAAHVMKVKDLECEVRNLTQQLEDARREASQSSKKECEKCKEMQSAFNACKEYKNALLEQTNRLKDLEMKFSTIEKTYPQSKCDEPQKEVPDSTKVITTEIDSVGSYTDALTFSRWDEAVAEVEELQVIEEAPSGERSEEKTETPETITAPSTKPATNKTMLNRRRIFSNANSETQSPLSESASPMNNTDDNVVLVPDTMEVSLMKKPQLSSLSLKRFKKSKPIDFSSPEDKENSSCSDSVIRTQKGFLSKKRAFSDSALSQTQNKRPVRSDPPSKKDEVTIGDFCIIKEAQSEVVPRKKPEIDSSKDEVPRKTLNLDTSKKTIPMKTVKDLLKEAEGWASNFEDFDVENTHLQQSLSVISGNRNMKCSLQMLDEDFRPSSTASKTDELGAWKSSVKRNLQKKALPIKPIKSTSRFKMTLEAPNANWKKPNYKQTKLTKSTFLNKNSQQNGFNTDSLNSEQCSAKQVVDLEGKNDDGSTMCGVSELASLASMDYTCIPGDVPSPLKSRIQTSTPAAPLASSEDNDVDVTVAGEEISESEGCDGIGDDPGVPQVLVVPEEEEIDAALEDVENKPNECDSFDRLPVPQEPNYKYKEDVVRGKSKRKQLIGFECKECEKYYSELGLSEEEMKERMQQCSRHRAKYIPPQTPEHFWELDFPDTEECKARGYVAATQKVKLKSRRRRPLGDE